MIPYLTIQLRMGAMFTYFLLEVLFSFMIGAGLYPILAKRVGLSAALKIILVSFGREGGT